MIETRRRSSRLSAAEKKSSAKAQKLEDSSDDSTSSSEDNSEEDIVKEDVRKSGASHKEAVKSPHKEKQASPAKRAGQRRSPGGAQKKRKARPDEDDPVQNDPNVAAAPDAAGPGPSSMVAAAVAKPKSAPRRGKAAPLEPLHNLTLWDIITKHPASVERAAKEWVDRYCDDKLAATSELMSMIVQAGGCDSGISVDDLESNEMDDVIKRLVDTAVREGGTEPFRDKKLRSLRSTYEAFWSTLITDLHVAGHLLDDYVCDRLTNLLIGMSSTKVRGYRHAGTLTAGLLMTGWVGAQQLLGDAISTLRHQEEAAQRQKKAGADRKRMIESLQRQAEIAQSQIRQLKSLLDSTFTAVFAVRFRDVGPEIRAVVVDLVGRWIRLLPATFMVDQYLKYVAWALSDRDAGVRNVAVSRVLELFGGSPTALPLAPGTQVDAPAHMPLLRGFVERFTGRFKELPHDIDEEVAVLGVRLLTRLIAVGAVTDAQVPRLECYRLLIDTSPAIRKAAAELAGQLLHEDAAKLEPRYAQRATEAVDAAAAVTDAADPAKAGGDTRRSTRSKGVPGPAAAGAAAGADAAAASSLLSDAEQRKKVTILGALLEMMSSLRAGELPFGRSASGTEASSGAPMDPAVVEDMVDALYERLPVLRSWNLIVDCLSDDLLARVWGPMGLIHLAALLAAAVKRVHSGALAAEKAGVANVRRQGPRMRALALDSEALMEASQVLLSALPRLLRRHQTDHNMVFFLVALIRDLKLELFSMRGDDAGWRTLLGLVGDQLATRGAVPELLAQCADTLTFAATSGPPALQPSAGMVLREVCEQLAASLAVAATAVRVMNEEDLAHGVMELASGGTGVDVEELLSLRVALLRAHAVLIRGGTPLAADPRVYDSVDELLAGCGSGRFLGPELTTVLAETQLVVLLNNVHEININLGAAAAVEAAGPVAGDGPGPSGANTAARVQPAVQKLQQARDALVAHMVALHSAAAAQCDALLDLDGEGNAEQVRCEGGAGDVGILQDVAFRVLSDVALVFGSKAWKGTVMEPACQLTLSNQVADLMWRHCKEVLGAVDTREEDEEEKDEDEEDEDGDELNGLEDDMVTGPHGASAKRMQRKVAVASKMAAVGCLGRLLAHDVCGGCHRTIAINLVAEFCNHGPELADLIRDICRELAASQPHGEMPHIYTGALRQSWAAVTAAGDLGEDEEHEALQDFAELAKHIASMYAGHGTSRPELLHILRDLTFEALKDAPTNLAILAWAAASFVPKLAPEDAATLVSQLEGRLNGEGEDVASPSGAVELAHDRDDPDWAPLHHYLSLVKAKASKGRVAPRALKGPSAMTPKAARNRKITFAPSPKGRLENAAEGGEEAAAAAVAANEPPAQVELQQVLEKAGPTAPEEGAWLRKALREVQKPPAPNPDEEDEEMVEPVSKQQQQTQRRVTRKRDKQQAVDDEAIPPGKEGRGEVAASRKTAAVGPRGMDDDVEAGPLNILAHRQSPSPSRSQSAGPSQQQPSLQAISDLRAGPSEAQLEEPGKDEEGAWAADGGGEPSDLQAITESRAKTAVSGECRTDLGRTDKDDDVEADGAGRRVASTSDGQEPDRSEGEGEGEGEFNGTPTVLHTEEEFPRPGRRIRQKCTPRKAAQVPVTTRAAAAAAAVAPAPSVSRAPGARSGVSRGSLLAVSDAHFDEAEEDAGKVVRSNGQDDEDDDEEEEGKQEMEEELGVQVSQGASLGINLMASESRGTAGRATDEDAEGDAAAAGEGDEEEDEHTAPPASSSRKRRQLSNADSGDDIGSEEAGDIASRNDSQELQPLPSISAAVPQVSLRADSVTDTQGQVEPPRRRVKRRRY